MPPRSAIRSEALMMFNATVCSFRAMLFAAWVGEARAAAGEQTHIPRLYSLPTPEAAPIPGQHCCLSTPVVLRPSPFTGAAGLEFRGPAPRG